MRLLLFTFMLALALSGVSNAADHFDAPEAGAIDKTADIAGLFAWTDSDAERVNLVMTVHPFAGPDAAFSNAIQYVFHINSSEQFGGAQTETLGVCEFDLNGNIQCWIGDEYVAGNSRAEAGLLSASGRVRVFAGRRDDPFSFAFGGFTGAVEAVVESAGSLEFDQAGCPSVPENVSAQLVSILQSDGEGGAATGTFDGKSVLALVIQVDADVVTKAGPILGVWLSTHKKI